MKPVASSVVYSSQRRVRPEGTKRKEHDFDFV